MVVGTLALDFRFEPNPRPLNREFIELIRKRRFDQRGERRVKRENAVEQMRAPVSLCQPGMALTNNEPLG
jgi:hypothetical protein